MAGLTEDTPLEVLKNQTHCHLETSATDTSEKPNPNKFRLIFSHSPLKSAEHFLNLKRKNEYRKYFKSFVMRDLEDSLFDKPEFKKEMCRATDSIVEIDDGKIMLIQYYRPDGDHKKRLVIVDNPLERGPLSYHFVKNFSDIGAFQWYRIDTGVKQYVDVVTTARYLLISGSNDLKTFKKFELTDPATRRTQKQSNNPMARFLTEDFRCPYQQLLTKDYFFFLSETSDGLFGLSLDKHTLFQAAENVAAYDYYLQNLIIVSTNGANYLQHVVIRDPVTADMNLSHFKQSPVRILLSKSANKEILLHELHELEGPRVKLQNWFTLLTGLWPQYGANIFLGCSTTRIEQCKQVQIEFSQFIKIPQNNATTPVKLITFIKDIYDFSLVCLAESRQLHFLYYRLESRQFGLVAFNKPASSDRDADVAGVLRLKNDRLLVYGYCVGRSMEVKFTTL